MKKFFISLLVLIFPFVAIAQDENLTTSTYKLGQTLYYLNQAYLDTVNVQNITDKAIIAMMKELDPHSTYIPLKDVKAMNEPLLGSFDGIGVEFAIINDTLTIQAAIVEGPSEKVGIKAGDRIIKVDGEIISGTGLTIERIHKYLRGERGSKVNLSVLRNGNKDLLEFEVTRDKIPLNSVDASYLIDNGIVYVRLTRFAATSHKEVLDAISNIKSKPTGIILDFRGNPGGFLGSAIDIANEFLEKGNLIVYTEGRTVKRSNQYANGRGKYINVPVAILVDESSASASEIVSGALQDWDRGIIIGQRTFGKGLVQQQLPLQDGSLLRLTVARYHTPTGRVIQKPYQMGKRDEYYRNLIEQYAKQDYYNTDSIKLPDSLKFSTLRLKRVVYGGGGITPDIIIKRDTSFYSESYSEMLQKGLLVDYINNYTSNNRENLLKQYPTFSTFKNKFLLPDSLTNDFISFCKSKSVNVTNEDYKKSINEIKKYLKGLMIKNLYGFSSFMEFLNSTDKQVNRAIEELRNQGIKKG